MLEAALEQMDGIIQGAKYELPQFDNFNIQVEKKYSLYETDLLNPNLPTCFETK